MAAREQWLVVGGLLFAMGGLLSVGVALTSDARLVGPGSRAPNFSAVEVATGDTVTLTDYSGSVILLNIWATWCGPCEEEMPSMQRLHEELGPSGLEIVAVSIDRASSGKVLEWVRERELTFDILHDQEGRIERIYQTTGVPESFIIDRDGLIVKKEIGAREWDDPAPVALLRRLLNTSDDLPHPSER